MIDPHRFAFLMEKGIVSPFPMSGQGITGVTRPACAMPSCDSGLGSPHPADHAETLTPPIAHRTSALHLAQSVYLQAAMPAASTANSGNHRVQTARHIGRGSPPLRA